MQRKSGWLSSSNKSCNFLYSQAISLVFLFTHNLSFRMSCNTKKKQFQISESTTEKWCWTCYVRYHFFFILLNDLQQPGVECIWMINCTRMLRGGRLWRLHEPLKLHVLFCKFDKICRRTFHTHTIIVIPFVWLFYYIIIISSTLPFISLHWIASNAM